MNVPLAAIVTPLKRLAAVEAALSLLRTELPANLLYHAYPHTEDVLNEVVRLATIDNLSPREIELLAVSAAWHDVGFIRTPVLNEPIAAQLAEESLKQLGEYSSQEIGVIKQMILDTALKPEGETLIQVASIPLACYLLDADLANFGREDFFEKSELQRREIGEAPHIFRAKTRELLLRHKWLTPAARGLWQSKKEHNLQKLLSN